MTPEGVLVTLVKAGTEGKAKAIVKGKGENLAAAVNSAVKLKAKTP